MEQVDVNGDFIHFLICRRPVARENLGKFVDGGGDVRGNETWGESGESGLETSDAKL